MENPIKRCNEQFLTCKLLETKSFAESNFLKQKYPINLQRQGHAILQLYHKQCHIPNHLHTNRLQNTIHRLHYKTTQIQNARTPIQQ